ncbi:MAG: ABC transporter permease [Spirochaetia bacterium]|nr:ABC transporter permease [Spirochaetia bacterium]
MRNNLQSSIYWAKKIVSLTSSSKQRKKHMAGTFFIMAFSVVPLILVIILTNGMTEGITRKYINLQTGNIQIRKYKANEYDDVSLPLIAEQLSGFEGAASSSIIYEGYGVIYSKNGSYTTMIRGVPTEFLKIPGIEEEIIEIQGSLALENDKSIVISTAIAEKLSLNLHDKIAMAVVDYSESATFFKPVIMEISGIISSGYNTLDTILVFINGSVAESLFETSGDTYVSVRLSSLKLSDTWETASAINEMYAGDGISISTWDTINASLFRNFAETKNILYVVMGLIIAIAGVNVSSSCIMLIQENYTSIGIMKALGAFNSDVRRAFLIALMTVSLVGTISGVVIGLIIGSNLNPILAAVSKTGIAAVDFYLIQIPIIIDYRQILLVILFTVIVTFFAVTIPLRKLKNISPLRIITS